MCELCGPQLDGPALRLEVYDEELIDEGQRQTLHFPLKMLNPVPLPSTSSPDLSGPCSLTSPPWWYQDSHAPQTQLGPLPS